jgi:hypothetical protein
MIGMLNRRYGTIMFTSLIVKQVFRLDISISTNTPTVLLQYKE